MNIKKLTFSLLGFAVYTTLCANPVAYRLLPTRSDDLENTPTFTEIITEVEGRGQDYLRYGSGFFPYQGQVYQYFESTDPSPSEIVFGTDNVSVYFNDLMDFGWDSYVKGTLAGDKITLPLPQTLSIETYSWAEEPYYNNLCVMTQTGEGENLSFRLDDTIKEITYTMTVDGEITLDALPEGKVVGVVTYFKEKIYDDPENTSEDAPYHLEWGGYWSGCADYTQIFTPLGINKIKMPSDVTPITYYVVIDGYNYPVNVAFKDNYMYIEGFGDSNYYSNFVMRATIVGNKASIPQNQYVGIYSYDNEMIITKCGYKRGSDIIFEEDSVNFEFNIDNEKHTLEAADEEMYLCFAYLRQIDNNGQNGLLDFNKNFSIIWRESYAGTPSNPYGLYTHDEWYKKYGYHVFAFNLDAFSTNGNILLTGDLYYRIYIDGELEIFEYDPEGVPYSHYYTLPEATSEIPFGFDNDADLDVTSETERQVGFYYDGVTTLGVQAVYYYNGKMTESDIVTLNVDTEEVTTTPSGVSKITDKVEVVKTEYFDLSGRKILDPAEGIFVKRTTLSNGKIRSSKHIIRRLN